MEDELRVAADEIGESGGRVEARVVDLADAERRRALASELAGESGFHVLVNNAAILDRQTVAKLSEDHWDRTLAVNLTAPVLLTRDLLPTLTRGGGSIINVSSRVGVRGFGAQAAYCASKFGLEAFTHMPRSRAQGIASQREYGDAGAAHQADVIDEIGGDRDGCGRAERVE